MSKRYKNEHEQEQAELLNDTLVYWRKLFDTRTTLKANDKRRLIRLCFCIAQLDKMEQTILTEKYFNLKPMTDTIKKDWYWTRKQTNKEIAKKLSISKEEYKELKRVASKNLLEIWLANEG